MQNGQGRGNSRQGYSGRGGMGRAAGIPPVGYGAMPEGYFYGAWGGYDNYHMPGFYPAVPPLRPPNPRGSGGRTYTPLGVQGAGILKRGASSTQGAPIQRRSRGHGSRAWAGRNRKNLTKEALDADLDEWRMKDKKLGGQSLDADLDEYWSKKDEGDGDGDEQEDVETKEEDLEDEKSTRSLETETPKKETKNVIPVLSPSDTAEKHPRESRNGTKT